MELDIIYWRSYMMLSKLWALMQSNGKNGFIWAMEIMNNYLKII